MCIGIPRLKPKDYITDEVAFVLAGLILVNISSGCEWKEYYCRKKALVVLLVTSWSKDARVVLPKAEKLITVLKQSSGS